MLPTIHHYQMMKVVLNFSPVLMEIHSPIPVQKGNGLIRSPTIATLLRTINVIPRINSSAQRMVSFSSHMKNFATSILCVSPVFLYCNIVRMDFTTIKTRWSAIKQILLNVNWKSVQKMTKKDKIIFLPSDYHCERYYICYNGKPLEQYYAPGIYWNSETDQCDFPENVNCTIEEPEEPELPQPEEIYCKDGIYFEEHPNSCEHYFICAYGYSILLSCAKGFQYDTENYWCNFADNIQSQCDAGKRFVKDSSFVGNDQLLFGTIL